MQPAQMPSLRKQPVIEEGSIHSDPQADLRIDSAICQPGIRCPTECLDVVSSIDKAYASMTLETARNHQNKVHAGPGAGWRGPHLPTVIPAAFSWLRTLVSRDSAAVQYRSCPFAARQLRKSGRRPPAGNKVEFAMDRAGRLTRPSQSSNNQFQKKRGYNWPSRCFDGRWPTSNKQHSARSGILARFLRRLPVASAALR